MSLVHKYITEDLKLRASSVITTALVQEIQTRQNTFPLATLALGRAVTGAVLLASRLKEKQTVSLHFTGDGPMAGLFAESSFEGEVRGYCFRPQVDPPSGAGPLGVGKALGTGSLRVTRTYPFQKQPHTGIVPLATGEIGEDIAHYLFQSEQIPSIISLAVSLDANGKVSVAGGVLIEALPGAEPQYLAALEHQARTAAPLSQRLAEGADPEGLLALYMAPRPLKRIDHPHGVRFVCRCTLERVERTLILLGQKSLEDMVVEQDDVEVVCEFCSKKYVVPLDRIKELLLDFSKDTIQ